MFKFKFRYFQGGNCIWLFTFHGKIHLNGSRTNVCPCSGDMTRHNWICNNLPKLNNTQGSPCGRKQRQWSFYFRAVQLHTKHLRSIWYNLYSFIMPFYTTTGHNVVVTGPCITKHWGRLKTGCWREYFCQRERKRQENEEHFATNNFIICILHQILLEW